MNLVGKIFTVLIFIMSLVLMSLVLALYTTHTNWRLLVENTEDKATEQAPLGYKYQLQQAENRNKELRSEYDVVQGRLDREMTEKKQVKAKLETENEQLRSDLANRETQLATSQQEVRDAIAQQKAVMASLEAMRDENTNLRAEVKQIQEDRDKQFDLMVKKTDDLHDKVNELETLQMRNRELAAEYARAMQVLRHFALQNDPEYYAGLQPPDFLNGIVLDVTPDLVAISLGSDDGLRKGHKMEVYRSGGASGNTYVGRIEVSSVEPNKAICKILKDQQRNQFQRNDRVATKLQ